MDLTIDQGNTYCKAALFDDDAIIAQFCVKNDSIKDLKEDLQCFNIDKAIISSVSEPIEVLSLLTQMDIKVSLLSHESKLPINIEYYTPETLGIDRVAAAVGAWHISPTTSNLRIDIGTAITYDVCLPERGFVGGNIAPGLDMRLKAMHTFTKKLPLLERAEVPNYFGKSTKEAMINGAQLGILAEINSYIEHAKEKCGKISVFLTGGDAQYFENEIKNSIFASPNLLMIGLREILRINQY